MRSVPHALYNLPSVAHVVAAYVRQLMNDFTSSLLLCRPTTARVHLRHHRTSRCDGGDRDFADACIAGASAEEEETYLLLRLCAQEARQRRLQRHHAQKHQLQQQQTNTGGGVDEDESSSSDWLWDSATSHTGDAAADEISGESVRVRKSLFTVEEELLDMFAAAEEAQRSGSCARNPISNGHPISSYYSAAAAAGSPPPQEPSERGAATAAALAHALQTPPLLSALLRFKPLLRDMQFLSCHLLLPRHAWAYHQREWVCVYEDVSVTLLDRLTRYRATIPAMPKTTAIINTADNNNNDNDSEQETQWASSASRVVMPPNEIEQLWRTLWELLGAAWRQRDRLWGAYRYLQGPRQLPPLTLNSQAAQASPPGVHSSPILRDHFASHLMQTATMHKATTGTSPLPPSVVYACDEDCCAFGPFTSSDIGISAERQYVVRQPLAAALRLLRVCVPATGRDALVTSTAAFAGFKYVAEPARRSQPSQQQHQRQHQHQQAAPRVVVPLFDPSEEDVRIGAAVPYLSPEVYLVQRLRQRRRSSGSDDAHLHAAAVVVHSFSDDVWNAAVVVLEAALCTFAVEDPVVCHLSSGVSGRGSPALPPCTTTATIATSSWCAASPLGEKGVEVAASPDPVQPSPPSRSTDSLRQRQQEEEEQEDNQNFTSPSSNARLPPLPTESVYADVCTVLMRHHRLPLSAAHNFLYAALHHLQKQLKSFAAADVAPVDGASEGEVETVVGTSEAAAVTPSPERLAREWLAHLQRHYDPYFVKDVLAGEVAAKGLCWRRSERWNAFGTAHIAVAAAGVDSSPRPTTATAAAASVKEDNTTGTAFSANGKAGGSVTTPLTDPSTASFSVSDKDVAGVADGSPLDAASTQSGVGGAREARPLSKLQRRMNPTTSYMTGSFGSLSVLSEDNVGGSLATSVAAGGGLPCPSSPLTQPGDDGPGTTTSSTAHHSAGQDQLQRRAQQPTLAVTLPSRANSFASFEVYPQGTSSSAVAVSAVQSPLRIGSANSSFTAAAAAAVATPTRLPQKLDRAVNALETPLMPLLGLPLSVVEPRWRDSNAVWERLARFLQRRTSGGGSGTAADGGGHTSSNNNNNSGSSGAGSGKTNGAVADAADVDRVEELLRLLHACVLASLRQSEQRTRCRADKPGTTTAADRACYAAVNHPFLRGVAERGLLSTYMTISGCTGGGGNGEGDPHVPSDTLPSLSFYVPARALLMTMAQLEERDAVPLVRRSLSDGKEDTAAAAASLVASTVRFAKQAGTLRTLVGDDIRAWEAARNASRRSRLSYLPPYLQPGSSAAAAAAQTPAAVRQARFAVDAVMHAMELSVSMQLHHVAQIRRLLRENDVADAASGGGAESVCQYLRSYFVPLKKDDATDSTGCVASPFFAVPPTLRGVVWGAVLRVPSSRKREAVFANAVFRTAAKPSLNDRQLSIDIPRCHAYHPLLATSTGSAQLQRVLKAWLFLHPRYAYWQGLDSVCALLLTVSPHDEALVLAQLNIVVERFIAHDDGGGGGVGGDDGFGSRSSLLLHLLPQSPSASCTQQAATHKPSMAEQLHRLAVVLRYADPLLAHYLFDVLGCTPELYAISWFLTLFSHNLPTRKVYLLWDLLFILSGPITCSDGTNNSSSSTCLVALCAAVMMHRRAALLSADFSGCLSAFSSGALQLDVAAAVGDTRQLMSVLPPSVLAQPCTSDAEGRHSPGPVRGGGERPMHPDSNGTTTTAGIAYITVEDVRSAWVAARRRTSSVASPPVVCGRAGGGRALSSPVSPPHSNAVQQQQQQQHWSDSGVYLVDIRPSSCSPTDSPQEAVLGAIHVPLVSSTMPPLFPAPSFVSSQRTSELSDRSGYNGSHRRYDPQMSHESRASPDAAGDGWGIVEDQERLQAQQQQAREALERHIADAAAELVRHLSNPSVAAIAPCNSSIASPPPPWPVHPIVLKTSMAPHVILLTSGRSSADAAKNKDDRSNSNNNGEEEEEVRLAYQLGLQLNACGVHNVSVLRGGVAAMRVAMPELVVQPSRQS
jgi:hypothetical protein